MVSERLIQLRAGEYDLAIPLLGIQAIISLVEGISLDMRSPATTAGPKIDSEVKPISLARMLKARTIPAREPSQFLLVGQRITAPLACTAIAGSWDPEVLQPVPSTIEIHWPGLIRALALQGDKWVPVIEPAILLGVIEGWLDEDHGNEQRPWEDA